MPPKKNPLGLNALQLKTLAILQLLAALPDHAREVEEGVLISDLPHPHGDHIHLGEQAVLARDATGLANPAVWVALERKGLIKGRFPHAPVLTPAGLVYDTGVREHILHHAH